MKKRFILLFILIFAVVGIALAETPKTGSWNWLDSQKFSGAVTHSGTVTNSGAVTNSGLVTNSGNQTTTGSASVGGTLLVTGASTLSGGVDTGGGTTKQYWLNMTLADDATYSFATVGSGGFMQIYAFGTTSGSGHYSIGSDASSALMEAGINADDADTDTDICVIDGGTTVTIKNRLGGSNLIKALYTYMP